MTMTDDEARMAAEAEFQRSVDKPFQFITCGGPCPKDGQPHTWDGPELRTETCSSGTCSKCGIDQMTYDMMNAE